MILQRTVCSFRLAANLVASKPATKLNKTRTAFNNIVKQFPKRFASSSSSSRLFTEKHEWISIQDNSQQIGRVGISNHAQEALGDVVYVQAPDVGTKFAQFDEVGAIESVKAASELLTPVSGEVTTVNAKLEEKPGLVNSDCYGEGWLYEIKLDDSKELEKLMDEDRYNKYLEETKDA